ncbi:ABC transporter ATP-binding protein [Streptosporangium sp. CA-135522]|uniref:ABC transporter ATP-binding protein n=1 Tax=Streptosporangium sp. CA-135522 TaxID=3240072 RepID=UPI003D8EC810
MTDRQDAATVGGSRELAVRAAHALGLAWRAGPVEATLYLVMTVMQGMLPAGVALLTKWLIDGIQFGGAAAGSASDGSSLPGISPTHLALGIGLLGMAAAMLPYGSEYVRSRLQRGVALLVQDRLYSSVNRLAGMARFENPAFLDRLRLAQQAAMSAPKQVIASLFGMIQSALMVCSLLGVLVVISPMVTLITVVAAIPALFVQLAISRQQADMMWRMSPRTRRRMFYQTLMLDLTAIKETRLFGSGGFLLGRMREETGEINRAEEGLDRRVLAGQGPLAVLGAAVAAGGLIWMIDVTMRGGFSIGDVSAFIAAVAGIQGGLSGAVSNVTEGYHALLMFGHYVDITQEEADLPVPMNPRSLPALSGAIQLDDVWFRYTDDGPWVLRGVTVTIPFGRSLALVGLNGAGKSTLVKLLCRMYDPTKGGISWDGVDIRDVEITHLRRRISAVFQDYMSYDLTAAENIGIGDPENLNESELIHTAARRAGAHDLVTRLPRGYDTMLSRIFFQDEDDPEQGTTLSGGQWQRIALARALMRTDRDLLILDEPSAGLDAAAEQSVHDRLREHQAGATSVLISHRLGVVRRADRIVVLQEGKITEEGSHDDLMAAEGEYARLFTIQASNYVDDPARPKSSLQSPSEMETCPG